MNDRSSGRSSRTTPPSSLGITSAGGAVLEAFDVVDLAEFSPPIPGRVADVDTGFNVELDRAKGLVPGIDLLTEIEDRPVLALEGDHVGAGKWLEIRPLRDDVRGKDGLEDRMSNLEDPMSSVSLDEDLITALQVAELVDGAHNDLPRKVNQNSRIQQTGQQSLGLPL